MNRATTGMLMCAMWVAGCTDDASWPCGERNSGPTDGECDGGLFCHDGTCIDADGEANVTGMEGTLGAAAYWEQYEGFATVSLMIRPYALCETVYGGTGDDWLSVDFFAFTGGPATLMEGDPAEEPSASWLSAEGALAEEATRTSLTLDAGEFVAGGVLEGTIEAEFSDRLVTGSFSALVCTDNGSR